MSSAPRSGAVPLVDPHAAVVIGLHQGERSELRPSFELAEDSESELAAYLDDGRVLVARRDGEVVGHLQLVGTETPEVAELKNMAVREDLRGHGIGSRLVRAALDLLTTEGARGIRVATATADVGNLRFYQRHGFRMQRIERDAFVPARGYPADLDVDGIPLRDRVWLDRGLGGSGDGA